jgi:CMP-N-acetylneuraminic acid synthetase
MPTIKNIYAMIPARIGSQRLKKKNLRLLDRKPLITYAIKSAIDSKVFKKVYINADDNSFKKFSKDSKVHFYKRNKRLGSSNTKSDDVVFDFFKSFPEIETLAWINTTTPFQTALDIKKIFNYYVKNKYKTLITVKNEYAHTNYKNKPLNYSKKKQFSRTQDLNPVQTLIYSLMIWDRSTFLNSYKKKKTGILSGKICFYPLTGFKTLMIKKEKDLILANHIMKNKRILL